MAVLSTSSKLDSSSISESSSFDSVSMPSPAMGGDMYTPMQPSRMATDKVHFADSMATGALESSGSAGSALANPNLPMDIREMILSRQGGGGSYSSSADPLALNIAHQHEAAARTQQSMISEKYDLGREHTPLPPQAMGGSGHGGGEHHRGGSLVNQEGFIPQFTTIGTLGGVYALGSQYEMQHGLLRPAGGGGGGGGVLLISNSITQGTISVAGGLGGTGSGEITLSPRSGGGGGGSLIGLGGEGGTVNSDNTFTNGQAGQIGGVRQVAADPTGLF